MAQSIITFMLDYSWDSDFSKQLIVRLNDAISAAKNTHVGRPVIMTGLFAFLELPVSGKGKYLEYLSAIYLYPPRYTQTKPPKEDEKEIKKELSEKFRAAY